MRLRETAVNQTEIEKLLNFFSGYTLAFLQEMQECYSDEESGLWKYYIGRIEVEQEGLTDYEAAIARYLTSNFDRSNHIVHAGIGVGTLTAALFALGFTVTGIESNPQRFQTAMRLQDRVTKGFKKNVGKCELIHGLLPQALDDYSASISGANVMLFTNVVSGWSPELQKNIIGTFPRFGHVLIDLRLFGVTRDEQFARDELLGWIGATRPVAIRRLVVPPSFRAMGTAYVELTYAKENKPLLESPPHNDFS